MAHLLHVFANAQAANPWCVNTCADGSPENGLDAFNTADGGPSEEGPSSVDTEAQGSGHNDGEDDDATSLPHVASNESVAAGDGIEIIALDSPTSAARKVRVLPRCCSASSRYWHAMNSVSGPSRSTLLRQFAMLPTTLLHAAARVQCTCRKAVPEHARNCCRNAHSVHTSLSMIRFLPCSIAQTTTCNLQAARGISDDGIRYGQPGAALVPAHGQEATRDAYSGLLAVSHLPRFPLSANDSSASSSRSLCIVSELYVIVYEV